MEVVKKCVSLSRGNGRAEERLSIKKIRRWLHKESFMKVL